MKLAWSVAVLLWLLASPALAAELNWAVALRPPEVHQGGIAQLRVSGSDIAGVKARRGGEEIVLFPAEDGSYFALLGVDLEQRPGPLDLLLSGRSVGGESWTRQVTIEVKPKEFPRETLSVSAAFDQIDRATLKRIEKEQAQLDRLWKIQSPNRLWDGPFVAPVSGGITSPFGLSRVINGSARSPHGGVDLKASLGSDVVAANSGRVVVRDEFFFSGKSLVLDHGGGLYTMYFHLSEYRAEKNAQVRRGEVIGLAGMTGRVTGPHLHWGARLSGARVDPGELLEMEYTRQ